MPKSPGLLNNKHVDNLEAAKGERLLHLVIDAQPHGWNRTGVLKLQKHLKKKKSYLDAEEFDSVVSLSQKIWNLFVGVVSDSPVIGSWTADEMDELFRKIIFLPFEEYFEVEISRRVKEEFAENIIKGLTLALQIDLESGLQHFLFLMCCCFHYADSLI